jgi:hypothetical protein
MPIHPILLLFGLINNKNKNKRYERGHDIRISEFVLEANRA